MTDPHADQPVMTAGTDLERASAATILVHGRGATARSILGMSREFDHEEIAYLAPQAAGNTWYPQSFLAPVEANEPHLSAGLGLLQETLDEITSAAIPVERILFLGFSQGACLASDFVARHPARYGGLVALSGGLIGEELSSEDYVGDLEGSPVFFGCSDSDPHIPAERVEASAAIFEQLGADVEMRLYEGIGHGVNQDELDRVDTMLGALLE